MRDCEVPFDVDKFISVVKALVHLAEDTIDVVINNFIECDPVDFVSSVFLSAGVPINVDPHVDNDIDTSFLNATYAVTKCVGQSVPLLEMLGRVDYTCEVHEVASGVLTPGLVSRLSDMVESFNVEVAKAQKIIDKLDTLLGGAKLANAYTLATSLCSAVNTIAQSINSVIAQHNTYFHDVESFKVGPVNLLNVK